MVKVFHPLVWNLLIGTVFIRTASFMTVPFIALYLHNELHASPLEIGLAIGVAPLFGTIGGFVGGYLTDRFGRKVVLVTTLLVWALVFAGFGLVSTTEAFIVLSALNGLCRAFFDPSTQALMLDFTEPDKRKRLFSLRYTAINIAAVLGPLAGVTIAQAGSSPIPFFITAVMYGLYALYLFLLMNHYEMRQVKLGEKMNMWHMLQTVAHDKRLGYIIAGGAFVLIGFSQFDSTLPQVVNMNIEDGIKLFSVLIAINAAVVLLLQLPVSILMERISNETAVYAGVIVLALGLIIFNFAHAAWLYIVGIIVFTMGEILIMPLSGVLIDQIAPEDQKGTYMGAAQLRTMGSFIGPILGGWLLTHLADGMYVMLAALTCGSLIFYRFAFQIKVASTSQSGL